MSQTAFSHVALVANPKNPSLATEIRDLVDLLQARGVEVSLDAQAGELLPDPEIYSGPRRELPGRADLVIVLGGDGTLLSVARFAAEADVPVLGINYGGLGFLTAIPRDEAVAATTAVVTGNYTESVRRLLRAQVEGASRDEPLIHDVLNDAVINKTELARIVELTATVDGDLVSSFAADGLIVCTTTGSTAYSLAAGGPIVMPEVDAIVLTPICPHTLTNRPLVLAGSSEVEIRQRSADQQVILTLDGQAGVLLEPDDRVTIRRSPLSLRLIQPERRPYFEILRTKLHWGTR